MTNGRNKITTVWAYQQLTKNARQQKREQPDWEAHDNLERDGIISY
jgi:hypothetical protein